MVEVFKTDVRYGEDALLLVAQLHLHFGSYSANFDLDDCDLILRVACEDGPVRAAPVIALLAQHGFYAEVLVDDFQPVASPSGYFASLLSLGKLLFM